VKAVKMGLVRFRVATEFNVVNVMVTDTIQKHVDDLIAAGKCLGCEKPLVADDKIRLHQCSTCYSATYRAICRGTTTREQLTAQGKVASQPRGPKPKNDYTASLRSNSKKG
jgi:hypothetical protein